MTDIRKYSRSTVLQAAKSLHSRCRLGKINALDYAQELNNYRLRDNDGNYWLLDPHAECWYLFKGNVWHSNKNMIEIFEAPASLFAEFGNPQDIEQILQDLDKPLPNKMAAPEALSLIVEEVATGFEQGTLSSREGERLLAQNILVDVDGRFWALGIRSRQWYIFKEAHWHEANGATPEDKRLFHFNNNERKCLSCGEIIEKGKFCSNCGSKNIQEAPPVPEAIVNAMPEFIMFGITCLPEKICDAWSPPPGFPDDMAKSCLQGLFNDEDGSRKRQQESENKRDTSCPHCGAEVGEGLKFCTNCGQKL